MPFSTLVVYEPLDSFLENKEYWEKYVKFYENYWGGPTSPFGMWFGNEYASFKTALSEHFGLDPEHVKDCLFIKNESNEYFIAPAQGASNMFSVENLVPFEWFILFEEHERKDFLSHWGFNSIHYDSTLKESKERLLSCLKNLDDEDLLNLSDKNSLKPFLLELISSLQSLDMWLDQFNADSNIILNYGDICTYIQPHSLKNENSVNDIKQFIELTTSNNFSEAELNLKIFFQKWDDIRNKCMGNIEDITIQ